jgi:hypothetical protein
MVLRQLGMPARASVSELYGPQGLFYIKRENRDGAWHIVIDFVSCFFFVIVKTP